MSRDSGPSPRAVQASEEGEAMSIRAKSCGKNRAACTPREGSERLLLSSKAMALNLPPLPPPRMPGSPSPERLALDQALFLQALRDIAELKEKREARRRE